MDLSEPVWVGHGRSVFCSSGGGGRFDNGGGAGGQVGCESCFGPSLSKSSSAPSLVAYGGGPVPINSGGGGSGFNDMGQALIEWSQSHLRNLWNGENTRKPQEVAEHAQNNLEKQLAEGSLDGGRRSSADDGIDVIAKAMSQLSVDQREQAYNDIHGIGATDEEEQEDPIKILECLRDLREKLREHVRRAQHHNQQHQNGMVFLPSSSSEPATALQLAMEQNQNYVMDESFLLMFLRAKEYDVTIAANCIISFLRHKMDLFGWDKLTKDITLDDLDADDCDSLLNGGMQYAPLQDQSGRHIFVGVITLEKWKVHQNLLRAWYYFLMAITKDNTQAQLRGFIAIHLFHTNLKITDTKGTAPAPTTAQLGEVGQPTPSLFQRYNNNNDYRQLRSKVLQLRNSLPIKVKAVHLCTDDPKSSLFFQMLLPFYNLRTLTRVRMEFGNHLEVQYKLLSYGIPLAALPVDVSGCCNNDYHKLWVDQRRQIEQQSRNLNADASRIITNNAEYQLSSQFLSSLAASQSPPPLMQTTSQEIEPMNLTINPMQPPSVTSCNTVTDYSAPLGFEGLQVVSSSQINLPMPQQQSPQDLPSQFTSETTVDPFGASPYPPAIYQIGPNDVLLGRGRAIDQHFGNVQFRRHLQQDIFMQQYQQTKKRLKAQLADVIRQNLQENCNVRFLIQHDTGRGWQLADDVAVREKISRTFRRLLLNSNKSNPSN